MSLSIFRNVSPMTARWLLRVIVLLMIVMSVLPAAAQSSCTISTRASNIRMRDGHSTTNAVVGTMPRNTPLQVSERFVEQMGRKTRIWYRLLKEQVAPESAAAEVWVGGRVVTSGDCENISTVGAAPAAPAAPAGDASAPAAPAAPASGVIMPQSGAWVLTLGDTVNISCDGVGSADFATNGTVNDSTFDIEIVSSGDSFVFDGVGYTRDGNGTWNGYYSEPEIRATGTAYIRVDAPNRVLGDIVVSLADVPGCTFKFPFWASPR